MKMGRATGRPFIKAIELAAHRGWEIRRRLLKDGLFLAGVSMHRIKVLQYRAVREGVYVKAGRPEGLFVRRWPKLADE